MRFPITGILASVSTALGLYGLWWYHKLDRTEQNEADGLAVKFAKQIYDKGLHELTSQQMSWINELVKGRMAA